MAVQSTIAAIQSAGAAEQAAATAKSNSTTLGKDDFLKLLTAQMQQQDPTQPMDNTAFVAQLAQFSSLEQMSNVNDTLTKMLTGQATALQTSATSMVGKTAVFTSDQVNLTKGQAVTLTANLPEAAGNVNLVVQDGDGNTVRTVALGTAAAGTNTFSWDGLDSSGAQLESGTYTAQISATDLSGKAMTVTQTSKERITGVTFESDGTLKLLAGGLSLSLSDISELDE